MNTPMILNGKDYRCVSCWEKMTTGQYQRIFKEWEMDKEIVDRDFFKLFSILSNSEFTALEATPENEVTIWNAIKWVVEVSPNFKELPKVLKFGLRIIDVPDEVGELSIGQNIHLKNELQGIKYKEEKISIAAAIFLQPLIDEKPFDMRRAKILANEIEQMPITLIYPIGFFLLSRALQGGTGTTPIWLPTLSSLKLKLKRMWRPWLR